ncbi:Flp family type IVb pilin [Albirhodobacter sp. R86504]|jgi:Flp pilus assembly pilin Flp|uniref:Flp family type IVb pilin n=1 Tax=Albirhodobacter sp. R86504 TaxID=3093848 RepID=UPI00366B2116
MTNTLTAFVARFRRDEEGATLVEYGVALGLAVIVGATALSTLAGNVKGEVEEANAIFTSTSGS